MVLTLLISVIVVPIALVTAFFAVEVVAGLAPLKPFVATPPSTRVAILIPAHNEERIIGVTLATIIAQTDNSSALIVIADNCDDQTANVARKGGAKVLVREDRARRGKGFALTFAREHLTADPPSVIVIVDADCRIDRHSLDALASAAILTGRPCQAVYLLDPDPDSSSLVQISTFAFMIKNLVRQRGLQRLTGRSHLTGTGMALPWSIFSSADLGGANIVEDLALGVNLATSGHAPMLVENSHVWSSAASAGNTLVQRGRWEGGYLAALVKLAPRAMWAGIRTGRLTEFLAGLDLGTPPIALLVLLNSAALVTAVLGSIAGASAWPLVLEGAAGVLAFCAVLCAWILEGRTFITISTLLRVPLYVFWKLPMYLGLAREGAPKEWTKTERD